MDALDACVMMEARRIVASAAECMEAKVSGDAPKDTGQLQGSISASVLSDLEFEVRQDGGAAPHGSIIDAAGDQIVPTGGGKALRFNVGGMTIYRASVNNPHSGWWTEYDFDAEFTSCARAAL